MMTCEEMSVALKEHGVAWQEKCHEAAKHHIPADFNTAEDYPNEYWVSYCAKWDELCPEFNPMTGKGYP